MGVGEIFSFIICFVFRMLMVRFVFLGRRLEEFFLEESVFRGRGKREINIRERF